MMLEFGEIHVKEGETMGISVTEEIRIQMALENMWQQGFREGTADAYRNFNKDKLIQNIAKELKEEIDKQKKLTETEEGE